MSNICVAYHQFGSKVYRHSVVSPGLYSFFLHFQYVVYILSLDLYRDQEEDLYLIVCKKKVIPISTKTLTSVDLRRHYLPNKFVIEVEIKTCTLLCGPSPKACCVINVLYSVEHVRIGV